MRCPDDIKAMLEIHPRGYKKASNIFSLKSFKECILVRKTMKPHMKKLQVVRSGEQAGHPFGLSRPI